MGRERGMGEGGGCLCGALARGARLYRETKGEV